MFSRFKKFSVVALLVAIFVSSVFGNLALVQPAYALPAEIMINFPQSVQVMIDKIEEGASAALEQAGIRAATYALNKVAYDSAVWLAAGGKGQGPLFETKNFGDYLTNVASEAGGAALAELSKASGFDLCKPPNIKVDLSLKIGLRNRFTAPSGGNAPTKPACTLAQFAKNWDGGTSKFFSGGSVGSAFNATLKGDDQSDFGFYTQATEKIAGRIMTQQTADTLQRQEGAGVKSKNALISNSIQIPASSVGEVLKAGTPDKALADQKAQLNAAIAADDIKVWPSVLSIFLSTLSSNLIKNWQNRGIAPDIMSNASTDPFSYSGSGLTALGRAAAESFFSELTTVKIKQAETYDLLSQLGNCPDSPGMYNCRAAEDLITAATQGITIRQALAQKILIGDRQLIPPDPEGYKVLNNGTQCYRTAYCLNNVKVLRQVRVLPLGFEIAVSKSNPDKPWNLQEVVDGFNNIQSPYYHLIDPNWVLKVPAAKCNALAYTGSLLGSDVPTRLQDCVDLQTCVGYDSNNNCVNYAYCTREKNTWNFSAAKCESQFATCNSFQNANGEKVSYLYRTLDTGSCNSENVGCTAYSLTQNNGSWVEPGYTSDHGVNNGAYFNSNLSSSCSANSAGCTAFDINGQINNFKKAPDYLGCYDANSNRDDGVQWPTTAADLSRVSTNPECQQYAQVCIPDEVSCNWYAPKDGGTRLPGRFNPAQVVDNQLVMNDQCDAKCVGYNAYKEMPTKYSGGQDVAYIIPSSGQTCTVQDSGCSSFTNLSTNANDMEKVEYYSYLRPCVAPSSTNPGKTFITYEGSTAAGYQLKTYNLVPDVDGGPKYFYKNVAELTDPNSPFTRCDEAQYKNNTANGDCRQFNDTAGKIYYRLLAQTIPVTDSCTPYRLNNPEVYVENGVTKCYQNGEYRDGSCFYNGLPGSAVNTAGNSSVCSAAVETCRPYKGNAGNNIEEVDKEDFENNTTLVGWNTPAVAISPESTNIKGSSLRFSGNGSATKNLTLSPGESYDLTFWAKGDSGTIVVTVADQPFGTASVGDTWNQYHFGPLVLGGSLATVSLSFTSNHQSTFFLDNIRLVRVRDLKYLVKKTLSVDQVCDSNLNDNLPGEALGCTAYTGLNADPNNNTFNLTGFSYLCRENAIGCTAMLDTHNTTAPTAEAYNVWLSGPAGTTITKNIGNDIISCPIPVGQNGCYTTVKGHTRAEIISIVPDAFKASTIYVPPDTATTSPIYLIASPQASCSEINVGCTLAGKMQDTATGRVFVTTTIKNDPDTYDKTLCTSEAVGCSAFTDSADTRYFKDPIVTGQKVCSYFTNILYSGKTVSGWFLKDPPNKTPTPCYPNYQLVDGGFGLWSYGNTGNYENYVGACEAKADKCTEYIDHSSNDTRYYLIKDDKLGPGTCDGLVSQRTGCALLDQTDLTTKIWNTTSTYEQSNSAASTRNPNDPTLVEPVSVPGSNDANVIIQVSPDRECAEWLQCKNSHSVYDKQTNKYRAVCDGMQRCSSGVHAGECGGGVSTAGGGSPITEGIYRNLSSGWNRLDYDGYSLLGVYPLEELDQVNISPGTPDWRLVKKIPCDNLTSGVNCASNIPGSSACDSRGGTDGKTYIDKQPCGSSGAQGVCYNHSCIVDITSSPVNDEITAKQAPKQTCRAYSEADAPFPGTDKIIKSAAFSSANLCNETHPEYCECDYTKVKFGDSLTKYYQFGNTFSSAVIPPGFCLGGTKDGQECTADSICNDGVVNELTKTVTQDGTCQKKKKQSDYIGWRGFCVETDSSRTLNADENNKACLTWYPVEALVGASDIFNQHPEAGYQSPAAGLNFCIQAKYGSKQPVTATDNLRFSPAGAVPDPGNISNNGQVTDIGQLQASDGSYKYGEYVKDDNFGYGKSFLVNDDDILNKDYHAIMNRAAITATGDATTITKENIDKISITVTDAGNSAANLVNGSTFELYPNDTRALDASIPQFAYSSVTQNNGGQGAAVGGFYLHNRDEMILFYASGGNPITGNFLSNGEFTYTSYAGGATGLQTKLFSPKTQQSGNLYDIWAKNIPIPVIITPGYCWANGARNDMTEAQCKSYLSATWTSEVRTPSLSIVASSNDNHLLCPFGKVNDNMWHAIRIRFNPVDGTLMGYDTAFCHDQFAQNDTHAHVTYKIEFKLRETCTVVADASTNQSNNVLHTVAWTNNVWERSGYKVPRLEYVYGTEYSPLFGSLRSFSPQSLVYLSEPANQPSSNASITVNLGNTPPTIIGAPYSCLTNDCVRYVTANSPHDTPVATFGLDNGIALFNTLFASVFQTFNYQQGTHSFIPNNNPVSVPNVTETGIGVNKPTPPEIHPLINCQLTVGKNNSQNCEEDVDNLGFTINEKNNGDLVQAEAASLKANMNFYMFADKNQMPIKKVSIDWGDGSIININGLYRNSRGPVHTTCSLLDPTKNKCVRSDGSPVSGTTCTSDFDCKPANQCVSEVDATNFGQIIDKTCDNAYFHAENTYYCSPTLNQCTSKDDSKCFTQNASYCGSANSFPNGCCIFIPRVQVKDNWGWCNGDCRGKGAGCYDGTNNNSIGDECDRYRKDEHWTYFGGNKGDGRVIVAPQ